MRLGMPNTTATRKLHAQQVAEQHKAIQSFCQSVCLAWLTLTGSLNF